tara:strand:+ start:2087 stop:2188 length:102 start_codon:yes stop_codon:yes gene_type:complete
MSHINKTMSGVFLLATECWCDGGGNAIFMKKNM